MKGKPRWKTLSKGVEGKGSYSTGTDIFEGKGNHSKGFEGKGSYNNGKGTGNHSKGFEGKGSDSKGKGSYNNGYLPTYLQT